MCSRSVFIDNNEISRFSHIHYINLLDLEINESMNPDIDFLFSRITRTMLINYKFMLAEKEYSKMFYFPNIL